MNFVEKNTIASYDIESKYNAVKNIVIPQVETPDEHGTKRIKDIFSTLNDSRIVMIDGEIDNLTSSVVCGQLLQLDEVSHDDIFIYINSPGGSITAGMAIFDTMMNVRSRVNTIGMGMCASMGSFLLAAGMLTGTAAALLNSEIMVHQPLGGFKGQATDFEIHANRIIKSKKRLTAYLAYFCSQNKNSFIGRMETTEEKINQLTKDCERDNFMTATEAVEYGLISRIHLTQRHKELIDGMTTLGFSDEFESLKRISSNH